MRRLGSPISLPVLLALCSSALLVACVNESHPTEPERADVVLDWTLNPAHSGLLTAVDRRVDRKHGVAIRLRTPPSSSDGVRLLLARRADFAVLDIHDLAIARSRGRNLVAVASVVGRPLASVIAAPGIERPRQLEGRTIAITGTPSDTAVTSAIVSADGGDPAKVSLKPSGWATVGALVGGRVDAAIGFLNEEGVVLRSKDPRRKVFRLEDSGVAAYPELVLVTNPATIAAKPDLVKGVVGALAEGTGSAVADPKATRALLGRRLEGADSGLLGARTAAALGALLPPSGRPASLDLDLLRRWAKWEAASGIVGKTPDVDSMFTSRFSGG